MYPSEPLRLSSSEPLPLGSSEPLHPSPSEPLHLRPTAELAERVLLPGDPGRALALAQVLITEPRMFNHHRGLWGYTGPAKADGEPLTIQSTGMGGPSTAIVVSELVALGARRMIRVGTCGALDPGLSLGDIVIAEEAICGDGASRALAAGPAPPSEPGPRVKPDEGLTKALLAACPPARAGKVLSVDLFYDPAGRHRVDRELVPDAIAIEMEAATLFALGVSLHARVASQVACLLAVTDTFVDGYARARLDDHGLLEAAERMGAAAVAALAV